MPTWPTRSMQMQWRLCCCYTTRPGMSWVLSWTWVLCAKMRRSKSEACKMLKQYVTCEMRYKETTKVFLPKFIEFLKGCECPTPHVARWQRLVLAAEGQLSPLSIRGKPEQLHVLSRQLHRLKKSKKYIKIFPNVLLKLLVLLHSCISFTYFYLNDFTMYRIISKTCLNKP